MKIRIKTVENQTSVVYGDTFAIYSPKEFEEFKAPLYQRLRINRISPTIFRGKKCLDAGCGGGRGSILMAESGAAQVIGVDLSTKNVETCRLRASQKGLRNVSFQQGLLTNIPFEDNSFDIVWCNGVLHHMVNPDQGLREITRVLKPGGKLWLYLYGSGGIYWHIVDWERDLLKGIEIRSAIKTLLLLGTPARRIGEWIDDWFVPHLRRYTVKDVAQRLHEIGFTHATVLKRGVSYDTSERRGIASQRKWMGDGDVRFFCEKTGMPRGHTYKLPDPPSGKGSTYKEPHIAKMFDRPLAQLNQALRNREQKHLHTCETERILICRSVHSFVRTQLESKSLFDPKLLLNHIQKLKEILTFRP